MFNINVPRLTDKGLLIEESRTNIATHADFTNAVWVKEEGSVTVSANATAAPDKTNTAYSLSGSGQIAFQVTDLNPKFLSLYAKGDGTLDKFSVFFNSNAAQESAVIVSFDLATGEVAGVGAGNPDVHWSEDVGNGWRRYYISKQGNPPISSNKFIIKTGVKDVADGVGTLYIWGPQVELGSFPPATSQPPAQP